MKHMPFWSLLSLSALAFGRPASAAEPVPSLNGAVLNQQTGIVTEMRPGGFALVTFGNWHRPQLQAPIAIASGPLGHHGAMRASQPDKRSFRRAMYLPHVTAAEQQYALPPGLLDALIWTESRYNPLALSKAGAVGLGQLMPDTARMVGVRNRYDPRANLGGSARYLRQMLDKFRMVHIAIAAYNAGPGAVERAGGIPRNGETPVYVRNVLRNWHF